MDANLTSFVCPPKLEVGSSDALPDLQQIIEFYEEAGLDYRHWSSGLNMHLGFYRWGMNPLARQRMLEQFNLEVAKRLYLRSDAAALLLDLGCGMGAVARSVARFYPRSFIKGVTLAPSQVTIASEMNVRDGLHERIEIFEGNYTRLPFAKGSADGVWAVESSCYAAGSSKEDLIREMARVLKPRGRFVVADCFVKRPERKMNLFSRKCYSAACKSWALEEMATLEHFTAALDRHGFSDLTVEDISWRTAPSLAHAPFAVASFLFGKALKLERLRGHTLNNLKASLLAPVIGANRSKFGYYLISGVRA